MHNDTHNRVCVLVRSRTDQLSEEDKLKEDKRLGMVMILVDEEQILVFILFGVRSLMHLIHRMRL